MKKKLLVLVVVYLLISILSGIWNVFVAIILLFIAFFAAVLLAALLFLNKLVKQTLWYKRVIPDKSIYPGNEWYREHWERNYDVVNIGSSSAKHAFNYSGLPVKAFNWGEQPQSLGNGFKVLKNYFSILKKKGVVIIALGPFSGLDVEGKWNKDANDKYYYILSAELFDDYVTMARRRKYPLLYSPKQSVKSLFIEWLGGGQANTSNEKGFIDNSEEWLKGWMKEFNIVSLDTPLSAENKKGQEKRVALLSDILEFCLERDLRPAIVIPPMHKSLSTKFHSSFRENYLYSFIKKANKWDVQFLNFMDDERFDNTEYFHNSFFMTEKGAKEFTKVVLKELNLL